MTSDTPDNHMLPGSEAELIRSKHSDTSSFLRHALEIEEKHDKTTESKRTSASSPSPTRTVQDSISPTASLKSKKLKPATMIAIFILVIVLASSKSFLSHHSYSFDLKSKNV